MALLKRTGRTCSCAQENGVHTGRAPASGCQQAAQRCCSPADGGCGKFGRSSIKKAYTARRHCGKHSTADLVFFLTDENRQGWRQKSPRKRSLWPVGGFLMVAMRSVRFGVAGRGRRSTARAEASADPQGLAQSRFLEDRGAVNVAFEFRSSGCPNLIVKCRLVVVFFIVGFK